MEFSKRLQQIIIDKGYPSPKSPNKANTQKLADAAGVSRQMAARYINGDAIPETKILRNISTWLECDLWWLLYGKVKKVDEIKSKICPDIFKFILSEMRQLIINKSTDQNEFNFLFDNIINIYNNISEIDAELESKKKSASIMINFIKQQYNFLPKN